VDFDRYQEQTRQTAVYPKENAIEYLALGLNGEAGEVAEKVKKQIRDDEDKDIMSELGDVLWYLTRLTDELGVSMNELAESNLDKLLDRKERGVIHGEGDDR
jgi:NTP pyrophosphatase (non-canonical NTP hydrolase)